MADNSNSLAAKEKAFLEMAATLATLFNDLQHDFSDIRDYALVTNFFNQLDGTIAFLQSVPSKMETIHKLFPQEGDADA